MPLHSAKLKQFVIRLSTPYANFCTKVIAPSLSVADMIRKRGVRVPIDEIPTGVDTRHFGRNQRRKLRSAYHLTEDTLIVGNKTGRELPDIYQAMDLFVFASQSETQGMVLVETMACGLPVIALDASGVREVVEDGQNGRLLPPGTSYRGFADVIHEFAADPQKARQWSKQARQTAAGFSREVCVRRLVKLYHSVVRPRLPELESHELMLWERLLETIKVEWDLIFEKTTAAAKAIKDIAP